MQKQEITHKIEQHFSQYGSGAKFIKWASINYDVTITPAQITRAKEGKISGYASIVFQIYLKQIQQFS